MCSRCMAPAEADNYRYVTHCDGCSRYLCAACRAVTGGLCPVCESLGREFLGLGGGEKR
jgi:hypothetical protein